jgi:hypothetical protein
MVENKSGKAPATLVEDLMSLPLADDVFQHQTVFQVQDQSKQVAWFFTDAPFEQLELIQVTDMQWGNLACMTDRVVEYRDWVLSEPNRFMIWTGDNIDAAHMMSKGTPWDNTGDPQSQVFEFCRLWAPARHRILGYVGGNHERRTIQTFGDLGKLIAATLSVPYSNGKQLIDVYFGNHQPFKISQWHGIGGARTYGAVAQNLYRFASDGDSQVYLMGHHHKAIVLPFWKERRGRERPVDLKTVAAAGSSFLDTWGSYGEVSGFSPSDVLMPRIVLERDGSWEVTLK